MSTIDLSHAIDLAWVMVGAFLVMLMQVGFAMVETGFVRAKNAVHTMAMNLVIYPVGALGFWLVGYGLMFGGVPVAHELGPRLGGHLYGLVGAAKFALVSVPHDPPNLAMFLFGVVFM